MSDMIKQETIIDPEDLSADGLSVMRFTSIVGLIAIVAFIAMQLFSFQPKWLYVTTIIVAMISYMATSGNSLGDILRGTEEQRDEWQQELATRARSLSFVIIQVGLLLSFIIFHILSFVGIDITVPSGSITSICLALIILLFLLPRAVMAWTVKPIPDEAEEVGSVPNEPVSQSASNGILKTIATFTFAFIASYLFFRFIN
ncbi:MAG: hypothetical protein ABJN69_06555 [Hellea sp.]